MTQDNQHNEMPKDVTYSTPLPHEPSVSTTGDNNGGGGSIPKDTVEDLALFIVEKWPPECDVSDHDEMLEDVVQALTTAYNKGVEVGRNEVRELLWELRAKEEDVSKWISKGGVDFIDNKARLDMIELILSRLTPLPDDKL